VAESKELWVGRLKDTEENMTPETSTKFGIYGGQFIPETLMPAIDELTAGLREVPGRPAHLPLNVSFFGKT